MELPARERLRGALEAVERVLNRGGAPDDVLRAVASILRERFDHYAAVTVTLREAGLEPSHAVRLEVPVVSGAAVVATLAVELRPPFEVDQDERAFLERVALLISPYCVAAGAEAAAARRRLPSAPGARPPSS